MATITLLTTDYTLNKDSCVTLDVTSAAGKRVSLTCRLGHKTTLPADWIHATINAKGTGSYKDKTGILLTAKKDYPGARDLFLHIQDISEAHIPRISIRTTRE